MELGVEQSTLKLFCLHGDGPQAHARQGDIVATHDRVCMVHDVAFEGIFPSTNYNGVPWPAGSWRASKAGQRIAGHYRLAFSEVRGDEEFMLFLFNWRSYRHDFLCHRCMAAKSLQAFAYTDLRLNQAVWLDTIVSHDDFVKNNTTNLCPLFQLRGFRVTRAMRDPMHGVNLGVAQHVAGNAMYMLARRSCSLVKDMDAWLEAFWHTHKNWCLTRTIGSTISQFSLANLNKKGNNACKYPLLHAKAANTHYLVAHLAEVTKSEASQAPHDAQLRDLAALLYFLADFFCILDSPDRYFSEILQNRFLEDCIGLLTMYTSLAQDSIQAGAPLGVMFHIVPKVHFSATWHWNLTRPPPIHPGIAALQMKILLAESPNPHGACIEPRFPVNFRRGI